MGARVVVLDYGSGNVRSAVRMLERVGATVELSADHGAVQSADGLFVPGVGNFHACMRAGGRPVMGVCVGMQVLFEGSAEPSVGGQEAGLGEWPGGVDRLAATVVPHMGWSTVQAAEGTRLLAGVENERFYFVHSYAALGWMLEPEGSMAVMTPKVTWAEHGSRFVAAVENGPLVATQFHPEKSGDAGAQLLENWVSTL
jgi:glutamine amidotransferase